MGTRSRRPATTAGHHVVHLAVVSERVNLSRLTPLSFLERSAAAFPSRVAVVDGDRRLAWGEVRDRARRLALGLQNAGIEKGDRVAYLAFNTAELLEAHYGVPAAGAVLVAVNTRLTSGEVAYILDHSGARVLVVDAALQHLVDPALIERVIVCGNGGDCRYDRPDITNSLHPLEVSKKDT